MWWVIPIAAAGIAAWLSSRFDDDAKRARNRWRRKRREVERSIEEHQAHIRRHLAKARRSYNFRVLTDMHYSSMRVADEAHKLLADANTSIDAMGKILVEAKDKRERLEHELRRRPTRPRRLQIVEELKVISDLRARVFPDKDAVKLERDQLLEKLRKLNARTKGLKGLIRDRCGARGREWYEERERRALKRKRKITKPPPHRKSRRAAA